MRTYKQARPNQFPNMAKLIREKCFEKNIKQTELSPILGSKKIHNGQLASHIQLGKQTVPLKHAKETCKLLDISREEFISAYLADCIVKIDKKVGFE